MALAFTALEGKIALAATSATGGSVGINFTHYNAGLTDFFVLNVLLTYGAGTPPVGLTWTSTATDETGPVSQVTDTTHGGGTVRINISAAGANYAYSVTVDGDEIDSGTFAAVASGLWAVYLTGQGDADRNTETTIEFPGGAKRIYPWDAASELDAWTNNPGSDLPDLAGGYITQHAGGTAYLIYQYPTPQTFIELSACIAAPGILRRAVTRGTTGDLATQYVSDDYVDVLTGTNADRHPELRFIDAPSAALAMCWQRDADVVLATGNGSPLAGGWGTVQTVRASRAKPTMCVLVPSHDLYLIHLGGNSNDIAYGQTLAWNGSSYTISSEVTVATDADDERGEIVQEPGGVLVYAYRTSADAVAILRSTDRGDTWA